MEWKPQPSAKAPVMEEAIRAFTGIDRRKAIISKTCAICSEAVTLLSFRDKLSISEFHITGMCQSCQDKSFFA